MFYKQLIRQFKSLRIRKLYTTSSKYEEKVVPGSKTPNSSKESTNIFASPTVTPTNFDKRILIWARRYPSIAEIPDVVTEECLRKAKVTVRLRIYFALIALGLMGFMISAFLGRRDVSAGRHILTERLKWYESVQREKKDKTIEEQ